MNDTRDIASKRSFLSTICKLVFLFILAKMVTAQDRPNILWVVGEDASVLWFGSYGNLEAKTPRIDALAEEGFRYTQTYANAPVCATQRSAWITGIHSISMGTAPMRSRYDIPHDLIKYYPDYLRASGYYTANNNKTDYNIGGRLDDACWDNKTRKVWKRRDLSQTFFKADDQPFFQIVNLGHSHESRAQGKVTDTRHSPENVTLRQYHPDTPAMRQNYAKYYDAIENLDTEVGKVLDQLEKDGVADNTIVFFITDHGGVLPRSKRFLFNSGIHVPLIVRIPEKFKNLWPAAEPGSEVDRLVSFLDLPKTFLSLTESEVPEVMQGRIFMGLNAETEPEYVFSYRLRMDERLDNQRAVRNKRYLYIKNYMPYVPWGQHLDYLWKMAATRSWEAEYKAGRTNQLTSRFFETKPVEELYDMQADPDNVVNLANSPQHHGTLQTMRAKLREWQLEIHDSGLLPETELVRRVQNHDTTIYELVRDPKLYDLSGYLDAADLALEKSTQNTARLVELLTHKDSALRYWGTVGLLMLEEISPQAQVALEGRLDDSSGDVAAMAAWALIQSGKKEKASDTLRSMLQKHDPATLLILNILDWSQMELTPFEIALNSLEKEKQSLSVDERKMLELLRKSTNLKFEIGAKAEVQATIRTWTGGENDSSFVNTSNWNPSGKWKDGDVLRFDGVQAGDLDLTYQGGANTLVRHRFTASQTSDVSIRLDDDGQARNFRMGNLREDVAIFIAAETGKVSYQGQSRHNLMKAMFGPGKQQSGITDTKIHNDGSLEFGEYVHVERGNLKSNYTLSFTGKGQTTIRGQIGAFGAGGLRVLDANHVLRLEGKSTTEQGLFINRGRVDFTNAPAVGGDQSRWRSIRIGNNIANGLGTLRYVGSDDVEVVRRVQIGNGVGATNQTGSATIENGSATGKLVLGNPIFNEPQAGAVAARTLTLGGSNAMDNEITGVIADNDTNLGGIVGLIKADTGRWILCGKNSYTGATVVEQGSVALGANASIDNSATVLVASAANFDVSALSGAFVRTSGQMIGGAGTIRGDLELARGAKLIFIPESDSLTVTGRLNLTDSFSVASLLNADGTTINWRMIEDGTYTLIETNSKLSHIEHFGNGNAYALGDGRRAYFEKDSLALQLIIE